MATITSTLKLNDQMSATFTSINTAMSSTLKAMGTIKGANLGKEFADASRDIKLAEMAINDMNKGFNTFSENANKATQKAGDGFTIMKGLAVNAITAIIQRSQQMITAFMGFGDEVINARARLDMINDGLQTTEELNNKIFQSAQRSRSSYEDVRKVVSEIGMSSGQIFKNNDQLIKFTELLNKQFMISGTRGQQAASVLFNISQAMNSGVLRGQDLNSVLMNTPQIARYIEKELKAPIGSIKDLAEAGKITSSVLVKAMFNAADEINGKFDGMADNFTDISTVIADRFIFAFEGIAVSFNKSMGQNLRDGFDFIMENIDVISTAAVIAGSIVFGAGLVMAAGWVLANLPLIALIATIVMISQLLNDLGITFADVLAFVGGVFGTFFAIVYNLFSEMWNIVAAFVEFFANVWGSPLNSVKALFFSVFSSILGIIETVANAIGKLFGKDWGSEIADMRNRLNSWTKDMQKDAGVKIERMETISVSGTSDYMAKQFGGAANMLGEGISKMTGLLGEGIEADIPNDLIESGAGGKALKTKNKGKLIDQEDIKLLTDIAGREYKLNYKQVTPQLTAYFGDVRETVDVEGVLAILADGVEMIKSNELGEAI